MWRYLVGAVAAMLLTAAGMFWFRGSAAAGHGAQLAALAASAPVQSEDAPGDPPAASEQTREEKRFARYDRDRNGAVARDEYLAARRKAFARIDLNGDGTLSFDEYAAKATAKFVKADADKSGVLDAREFAATRVVRKTRPRPGCPPAVAKAAPEDEG